MAPVITLGVPCVTQARKPAILIQIIPPAGNHVAVARVHRTLHDIHAVQLPPDQIRIKEMLDMRSFRRRKNQLVVVVRDEDFFLAKQLPVVTVNRPSKYAVFILISIVIQRWCRRVIKQVGILAHAPLSRQILPDSFRIIISVGRI